MPVPPGEHVMDAHLLKLQRLQNRILHSIGNLDRCTAVHELQVAFKIPYVYVYITKLCRTKAEVLKHVNTNAHGIRHEARHRKFKRLKLGSGSGLQAFSGLTAVS
jgi:hypothetical protein